MWCVAVHARLSHGNILVGSAAVICLLLDVIIGAVLKRQAIVTAFVQVACGAVGGTHVLVRGLNMLWLLVLARGPARGAGAVWADALMDRVACLPPRLW